MILNVSKCLVSSFRELILWFGPSPSSRITRIVLCGRNFPWTNVVGLNTLSHWSRIHLGASQKLDEVGYTIVLMDPRWLFFLSETWMIWAMVITRGGIDQLAEFLCQFFPAHGRTLVKAPHGTRWTRHFRIILGLSWLIHRIKAIKGLLNRMIVIHVFFSNSNLPIQFRKRTSPGRLRMPSLRGLRVDVPKVHCRPDWPQVGILERRNMGGSSIDHLYKWVILWYPLVI